MHASMCYGLDGGICLFVLIGVSACLPLLLPAFPSSLSLPACHMLSSFSRACAPALYHLPTPLMHSLAPLLPTCCLFVPCLPCHAALHAPLPSLPLLFLLALLSRTRTRFFWCPAPQDHACMAAWHGPKQNTMAAYMSQPYAHKKFPEKVSIPILLTADLRTGWTGHPLQDFYLQEFSLYVTCSWDVSVSGFPIALFRYFSLRRSCFHCFFYTRSLLSKHNMLPQILSSIWFFYLPIYLSLSTTISKFSVWFAQRATHLPTLYTITAFSFHPFAFSSIPTFSTALPHNFLCSFAAHRSPVYIYISCFSPLYTVTFFFV